MERVPKTFLSSLESSCQLLTLYDPAGRAIVNVLPWSRPGLVTEIEPDADLEAWVENSPVVRIELKSA